MKFSSVKKELKRAMAALILSGLVSLFASALFAQDKVSEPTKTETTAPKSETTKAVTSSPATEETTQAPSSDKADKSWGFVDLFLLGSWTMYPLALSSIIAMGIIFERIYFLATAKLLSKGYNIDLGETMDAKGLDSVRSFLDERKEYKITQVLAGGIDVSSGDAEIFAKGVEREAAEVITVLERGLVILAAVSTIAPLIGFLGTVSGMINAFDAIANADQVNAKVVAGGIKEALITTAAGLIVAIPAMTFHQYLTSRIDGFTSEIEEAANRIYKEFLKRNSQKV
ncbi:MotA/TolQ/ExbB proton channel family protein [Leptospira alstonii]|uniref:Transporter, MotA/TolQ/ExbB proton channel family protein n=2 Tax=Leptospira alstonii TaxID=28452 RepID=M6D536_9LEPT|nr:MotA/TolQ/ExbB proton channel family protein [Leptospira alstonii]EMJ96333.1 transporter, MotA/TolQ/ExbB proton channel family protein [Leptospira alstonii serovar Sichuan str. 79601]EQA81618.1 transporter, MotA/TolQ/ExbB proton channel family protein [Leptospira alstonii serovar Pingchang str. 80-412]